MFLNFIITSHSELINCSAFSLLEKDLFKYSTRLHHVSLYPFRPKSQPSVCFSVLSLFILQRCLVLYTGILFVPFFPYSKTHLFGILHKQEVPTDLLKRLFRTLPIRAAQKLEQPLLQRGKKIGSINEVFGKHKLYVFLELLNWKSNIKLTWFSWLQSFMYIVIPFVFVEPCLFYDSFHRFIKGKCSLLCLFVLVCLWVVLLCCPCLMQLVHGLAVNGLEEMLPLLWVASFF